VLNNLVRAVSTVGMTAVLCAGTTAASATATGQRASSGLTNRLHVTIAADGYRIVGHPRPGRIAITVTNGSDAASEFSFQPLKPGVSVDMVLKALKTKGEGAASKLLAGDSDAQGYGEPSIVGPHSTVEIVTTPVVPLQSFPPAVTSP
jgi:hypothetical protein